MIVQSTDGVEWQNCPPRVSVSHRRNHPDGKETLPLSRARSHWNAGEYLLSRGPLSLGDKPSNVRDDIRIDRLPTSALPFACRS